MPEDVLIFNGVFYKNLKCHNIKYNIVRYNNIMDKIYKIKSVQKTKNQDISDRKNVKPKRLMSDIRALFRIKAPETIIIEDESKSFYDSLALMTENDIVLNEVAKNVKKPPLDIIRYAVLAVLVFIMVYAGYQLVEKLYLYVSAGREHDRLSELFWADFDSVSETEILRRTRANAPIQDLLSMQRMTGERVIQAEVSDGVRDIGRNRESMQRLRDINNDFYCWIRVSHTRIDYPVVQAANDEYYLHRSFERERNPSGAIFVDSRNHREIMRNRHMIIYGHNMLDGSMFQPILDFGRFRDYFMNGIIELITEDAVYYYEIFSARDEDPRSGYIEMNFTDEEWVDFLYEQQELSYFTKNLSFTVADRIVTLSTCVNEALRDWRFIIQAVLVEVK